MGNYNPHFPTVIGNELAPLAEDLAYLDTGTLLGYTFMSADKEDVITARVVSTEPPTGHTWRKCIAVEIYPDGNAPGTGALRKIFLPITNSTMSFGNAAMSPGILNPTVGMLSPGDGEYVELTGPDAYVNAQFDTNGYKASLLDDARIVDVSIRYAISGPFDTIPNAMKLSIERTSGLLWVHDMDETLTGPAYNSLSVAPRTARLGDLNPMWNTTIRPDYTFGIDTRRMPWKKNNGANNFLGLRELSATGGTTLQLRVGTTSSVPATAKFKVQFLGMEVTYGQEGRVAAGGIELRDGPAYRDGLWVYDVPLWNMGSYGFTWDSIGGYAYMMAVTQGYCGAISVSRPVPMPITRVVPGRKLFAGHRGVIIRKTIREGEEWLREEVPDLPVIVPFSSDTVFDQTTIYSPSQVYNSQLMADVAQLTFTGDTAGRAQDTLAGRSYTHVRFWARCLPGTEDGLRVRIYRGATNMNAEATIQRDAFELLPEDADGWRRVTLELSAPYVSQGTGTVDIVFTSTADRANPWQVLGAYSKPDDITTGPYASATYGGTFPVCARVDAANVQNADLTAMLIEALPAPTDLAAVTAVQSLSVVDEYCGVPVNAIPTGIRYVQVSWTPVNTIAVAGFAHYEVQRRDTTMPAEEWETVATITNAGVGAFDDYEARVGVVSSYRVRMVHEDDYTGAWSTTATATVAAPGVTGTGVDASVLMLTSNHNPSGNLAYVMSWDGSTVPNQEMSYVEGGLTALQSMYGRDNRVAFRPLERGGVEFTRTLLVNAAGVPSETLDRGVTALRDLAWSLVPNICVRDERHNRWLTTASVPSSAHRDVPRRGHLVNVPVTFAEVSSVPAPVDYADPCEGLTLENRAYLQETRALPPAALVTGTRVLTDTFTRTVAADAWGSADTGQAWTKTNGGATEVISVSGGTGRIVSGATAVETRLRGDLGIMNYRLKMKIIVPAVATGDMYYAGPLLRRQDNTNFYRVELQLRTGGTWGTAVSKMIGGVNTTIRAYQAAGSYTAGDAFWVESLVQGTTIRYRVWKDGSSVPNWTDDTPQAGTVFDTSITATVGRVIGIFQARPAANSNANLTLQYDSFTVDRLVGELDIRALIRPVTDEPRLDLGTYWSSTTNPQDVTGEWHVGLEPGKLRTEIYGVDTNTVETTKLLEMGLVKNRLSWIRVVITGDDSDGTRTTRFYGSFDGGSSWTLVETVDAAAYNEPIPILAPDQYLQLTTYSPGGVWVHKWEVRADGVLVASPDFAAQPDGTTSFADAQGNVWTLPMTGGLCAGLD